MYAVVKKSNKQLQNVWSLFRLCRIYSDKLCGAAQKKKQIYIKFLQFPKKLLQQLHSIFILFASHDLLPL